MSLNFYILDPELILHMDQIIDNYNNIETNQLTQYKFNQIVGFLKIIKHGEKTEVFITPIINFNFCIVILISLLLLLLNK